MTIPRYATPALLALLALGASGAAAQTFQTMSTARALHGETALAVDVTYAAGRFDLRPGDPGDLYRMELRYDASKFEPVRDYDADAGVLRLGLRSVSGSTHLRGNDKGGSLDLALSPDVPLTLAIKMGAARADAEFGGLALRSLKYQTGASQSEVRFSRPNPVVCDQLSFEVGAAEFRATGLGNSNCRRMSFDGGVGSVTLDFSGDWRGSADATVHVAIGSVKLLLPRDLGVAITLNRFLASFDQAGFTRRGDAYYSDNFDTAQRRLNLRIEAAFGGIDVARIDQ